MKNKIKVIGLGPGNIDYITGAGIKAIKNSEVVIGGKRHLNEIEIFLTDQEKFYLGKLDEMKKYIENNLDKEVAIIVSGDTGYYSLLTYLRNNFPIESLETIPGISSFQYLFGKLNMTWEKYSLCSVHGRECDYIKALRNSEAGIVLLTDNINNPISLSRKLIENGFENIEVIVGEKLSYQDEKITRFFIEEYKSNIKDYSMNVTILRKG